ncbi:MAG: hypothetical protein IT559_01950 [Alphaproteobacteria bacterium]|nr:hypothetical protein [Alphaproteobacteria bacterium]
MASTIIDLWARTQADMKTLQDTLTSVFGGQEITIEDKGSFIWRDTGSRFEDTRVGYRPAWASDEGNPTLRHLAQLMVDDCGAETGEKLKDAMQRLPEGSVMHGGGITMAPMSLS